MSRAASETTCSSLVPDGVRLGGDGFFRRLEQFDGTLDSSKHPALAGARCFVLGHGLNDAGAFHRNPDFGGDILQD